jgi:hypothetical protein
MTVDAYKGEAHHAVQRLVQLIKNQHYFNRYSFTPALPLS